MSSYQKTPGPVEKMRGPRMSPVSTRSPYDSTSVVDVCGSRVAVTPYARFAMYIHTCERWMPKSGHMCACVSTNPGRTVSYTHLRAHETPEHLVCRLLLEK